MSANEKKPAGPDFTQGVDPSTIPTDGALLGHVGDEAVIVARTADGLKAISNACSHYGGPLNEGLRTGDSINCPWHHACFSLRTGRAEKAPALAPVDCWQVDEEDGKIFVRKKADAESSPLPLHADKTFVIVGGGGGGFAAAQRLRELGFDGTLIMLSDDADAPYDRPNVSKELLDGSGNPAWMPLKDADFYTKHRIDLRVGVKVASVDAGQRKVMLESGEAITYDRLLLATGAEPIRPEAPGFDHPHAHTLRSMKDAAALIADVSGSDVVAIVGSSFIGLEVAASLRKRGASVHVIGPDKVPLLKMVGPALGARVQKLHESKGVVFHMGRRASGFIDGKVTLDDGTSVEATRLVLGVGVTPRVELAEKAGLHVDNGVIVDRSMRSSDDHVFAIGDIARFPGPQGEPIRVEHWAVAERHGQVAASAMIGFEDAFREPPFFWTSQWGKGIRYVGHAEDWDEIEELGSVEDWDCELRFKKGGKVLAVVTADRDLASLKAAEALTVPA